jgi:hypothetical protein
MIYYCAHSSQQTSGVMRFLLYILPEDDVQVGYFNAIRMYTYTIYQRGSTENPGSITYLLRRFAKPRIDYLVTFNHYLISIFNYIRKSFNLTTVGPFYVHWMD